MTLDKSRFIVRYYLFLVLAAKDKYAVEEVLRKGTNLCSFINRIFFETIFIIVLIAIACLFIFMLLAAFWFEPLALFLFFIGAMCAALLAAAIIYFIGWLRNKNGPGMNENIVLTYIRAIKAGICPIIKFKSEE